MDLAYILKIRIWTSLRYLLRHPYREVRRQAIIRVPEEGIWTVLKTGNLRSEEKTSEEAQVLSPRAAQLLRKRRWSNCPVEKKELE